MTFCHLRKVPTTRDRPDFLIRQLRCNNSYALFSRTLVEQPKSESGWTAVRKDFIQTYCVQLDESMPVYLFRTTDFYWEESKFLIISQLIMFEF